MDFWHMLQMEKSIWQILRIMKIQGSLSWNATEESVGCDVVGRVCNDAWDIRIHSSLWLDAAVFRNILSDHANNNTCHVYQSCIASSVLLSGWMVFVKLNLTEEALHAVWDFFKTTCYTMYLGYLGMLVFAAAFLLLLWQENFTSGMGMYFNLLPLAIVILPTKLPAKANVIGVIMFAGLLFLI